VWLNLTGKNVTEQRYIIKRQSIFSPFLNDYILTKTLESQKYKEKDPNPY
jgi:hypothetical protein